MSPEEIRQYRGKLSRGEFADKIGVSPRTVESWEQGLKTPEVPTQILIKKLFRKKKI